MKVGLRSNYLSFLDAFNKHTCCRLSLLISTESADLLLSFYGLTDIRPKLGLGEYKMCHCYDIMSRSY